MTNANDPINYFEYSVASEFGVNESALNLGLTKRELIAAMALQGMLAACNGYNGNQHGEADNLAKCAVIQADALINQLNK